MSATVDVQTLVSMTRPGAAAPVFGISVAVNQQSAARTMTSAAISHDAPFSEAAMPPAMVPIRIAEKVALSMKALPAGSSRGARRVGRIPYLIGPKRAAMTP